MLQFSAALWKNGLEKRRNIRVTCCECCSHLGILVLLLLGFGLSLVEFYYGSNYARMDIPVPPAFVLEKNSVQPNDRSNHNPLTLNFAGVFNEFQIRLRGPLIVPSFDTYISVAEFVTGIAQQNPKLVNFLQQSNYGRSFGNLLHLGALHFSPYPSAEVSSLVAYMNTTTTTFSKLTVHFHASETEAVDYILHTLGERTFALIAIREILPTKVNYVLRLNYSTLPNTNQVVNDLTVGLDTSYQKYFLSGFLTLQNTVDTWALDYISSSNGVNVSGSCAVPNVAYIPMPTYPYDLNPFYPNVGFLIGFALAMTSLYPMSRLVKTVVEEKETRMREVMKIMGLTDTAHRLSWFVTAFVLFFWIAVSSTYVVKVSFFPKTNTVLMFFVFFFFAMSEINLCFLISVFFSNSKLAAIVGPFILLICILPRYIFFNSNLYEASVQKYASCLLSPTAFTFAIDIINGYEYTGIGLQFSNLSSTDFNVLGCIELMIADFFIYGLLAWYLDQVIPHEFGTPRHPLFLLQPSYWRSVCCCFGYQANHREDLIAQYGIPPEMMVGTGTSFAPGGSGGGVVYTDTQAQAGAALSQNQNQNLNTNNRDPNIESLSGEMRQHVPVVVHALRKQYPNGKVAVERIDLAMVEGQITCLLGHNGAGKSTAISMMTGLTTITHGDCSIYGYSLKTDLTQIRKLTGICPQHNVLFMSLTVRENLKFFGSIKGLWGSTLWNEVDRLIHDVGLTEKKNTLANSLSGGMKRKLQLAIALIGGSKFVLLDEVTSGMDPYSRRSTWELLEKYKTGRVILLTTHFLEEADILGDRIAIMSEGRIRCAGSSLFLKTRFGAGYLLSMAKTNATSDVQAVEDMVTDVIPEATVTSHVAGEIIFCLPLNSVPRFAQLFSVLAARAEELSIASYGVSLTSLEQVFVKLAKETLEPVVLPATDDAPSWWMPTRWSPTLRNIFRELTRDPNQGGGRGGGAGGGHAIIQQQQQQQHRDQTTTATATAAGGSAGNGTGVPYGQYPEQVDDVEMMGIPCRYPPRPPESIMPVNYPPATNGQQQQHDPHQLNREPNKSGAQNETTNGGVATVGGNVVGVGNNDVVDILDERGDASDGALSTGTAGVQFLELINKRFISARRDKKGFFFQVIFPAVQIILILAILTVSVSPAGHTLRMNASMFGFTPLVLLAGAKSKSYHDVPLLSKSRMKLSETPDFTSYALSNNMLGRGSTNQSLVTSLSTRMGAYVFGDEVYANLTVHWDWVKKYSPYLIYTAASIPIVANYFEHKDYRYELGATTLDLSTLFANATSTRLAIIRLIDALNLTSISIRSNSTAAVLLKDAEKLIANSTIGNSRLRGVLTGIINTAVDNNSSVSTRDLVNIVNAAFDFANGTTVTLPPSTVSFYLQGVEYVNVTGVEEVSLVLRDVNIAVGSTDIHVGNVTLPVSTALQLLPDGIIEYVVPIPSGITLMHNASSPHAAAMFRGELMNAELQRCYNARHLKSPNTAPSMNVLYVAKNHPLPLTAQQELFIRILLSILASLFILLPLSYIPASFVTFIVRERTSKCKHLQLVSSVSPFTYWTATYLWDALLFLMFDLLVIACFYIYGTNAAAIFVGSSGAVGAVFLLLLFYGCSVLPLCYLYSMAFDNHSTAQISIMAFNFASGFVAVLAYFIMINVPLTVAAGRKLVNFFRFFPPYLMGEGLINVAAAHFTQVFSTRSVNYFSWNIAGRAITFLAVEAVGYFGLVLLTEVPILKRVSNEIDRERSLLALRGMGVVSPIPPAATGAATGAQSAAGGDDTGLGLDNGAGIANSTGYNNPEDLTRYQQQQQQQEHQMLPDHEFPIADDDDIRAEEAAVEVESPDDYALFIRKLVKVYPANFLGGKAKYAVRGLSLRCSAGERFGFLGINGAGKTTTLGVLTGDVSPTDGDIYVAGLPLADPRTRLAIGYCPQTDPLFDLLNVWENLWFYGRIRGIETPKLYRRVSQLIDHIGLSKFKSTLAQNLSGGNKRKLSLGIALIGAPRLLLLDEPSSGMDPVARRQMWEVISSVSERRSVVLTTHVMEECEALCTRIGIMVDGKLQCIGTSQHLKSKLSSGYQLETRFTQGCYEQCLALCHQRICAQAEVEEHHGEFMRLKLPTVDLATAFQVLEESKSQGLILDYHLSQNTLEQVFIKYAREQEHDEGAR